MATTHAPTKLIDNPPIHTGTPYQTDSRDPMVKRQ
jgi:hypothetical protein